MSPFSVAGAIVVLVLFALAGLASRLWLRLDDENSARKDEG